MAEAYKRLAQGYFASSSAKLYDVPSSTEAIIKTINITNATGTAREVTLYHCDKNSPYMLKFFLYLTDVEETEDGPFTYVEGSAYQKPQGWLQTHRVPDEQIERIYGKERIKPLFAKKGDLLAALTTGYHKGEKVKSKDRSMLTLNFVCAPEDWSVKTQYDIKAESCAKLAEENKLPLIDFLYVVE